MKKALLVVACCVVLIAGGLWFVSRQYRQSQKGFEDHLPSRQETRTEVPSEKIIDFNKLDEETAFTELSSMFYDAIKKALNESELILLEPIYHTIIQLHPDYIKNTLSLLSKYSAKIKDVNQEKDYQAIIEILLPVRNSIKFAEDIRSSTSGRAFWQNEFYAFMEVPNHEAKQIINDLRFMKGISW